MVQMASFHTFSMRLRGVGRSVAVLLAVLWLPLQLAAQSNTRYTDYINQYMRMAIEQMQKYQIPASITLAQGLLESGAGTSRLAREGNNHFGIKCGTSWTGPYMLVNDDAPNEHFRVYASAEQSYEDHSLFLRHRGRYAQLFQLKLTDYKGWAHGLKAAGYATNPQYAYSLIDIIERYNLQKLDQATSYGKSQRYITTQEGMHSVFACNQNFYTIARQGDTYESIGKEMGISARKLRKYNEVDKHYKLQEGDVVFFQQKQKKADKSLKGIWYRVNNGDSMYSIAQRYGMRVATLYKNNFKDANYVPVPGDLLLIR